MGQTSQFCTFSLDQLLFGVDLQTVQEVIRELPMTPVPLAPAVVAGIMNLRGQLVTALDLRQQLEMDPAQAGLTPMNVVVRSQDGAVSLLVDQIGDVVEVNEASFERAPETLQGKIRTMILGVHKLDARLLHVLDVEKACQVGDAVETAVAAR
jgi:purine-binding chemotaxis protein CheW